MEKILVGYRFHPTGEELINHYLKNKILGKPWLVDDAISEINICTYDPIYLPSLSKIQSEDPVWYFFTPREYTSGKKKGTKRTTVSGFWKATGVDRKIKDKRGNREIGIKKTLVYYQGRVPNGVRTSWVMHEYHITCLPLDQRNYVICKVMYKGEEGDILYGNNNNNNSSVPEVEQQGEDNLYTLSIDDLSNLLNEPEDISPSLGFNPDTLLGDNNNNNLEGFSPCDGFNPDTFFSDYNNSLNVQPQTPYDNEYRNGVMGFNGEGIEDVISYERVMQENRNNHMAKKPVTGIIVDYSSGSDAESISATSYQGTSSPNDSVGSSNKYFPSCSSTDSCKDLQTSEAPPSINRKNRESQLTRRNIPSKQEVKEGTSKAVSASIEKKSSMAKTEKKGWFITEETTERNRKNPRYIYLTNMIIGFFLLVSLLETSYRFY